MASLKEWGFQLMANELNLGTVCHCDIVCGIKETEKAVYAMFYTGYDNSGKYPKRKCHWIPKSAIENIEELNMCADYDEAVTYFTSKYATM